MPTPNSSFPLPFSSFLRRQESRGVEARGNPTTPPFVIPATPYSSFLRRQESRGAAGGGASSPPTTSPIPAQSRLHTGGGRYPGAGHPHHQPPRPPPPTPASIPAEAGIQGWGSLATNPLFDGAIPIVVPAKHTPYPDAGAGTPTTGVRLPPLHRSTTASGRPAHPLSGCPFTPRFSAPDTALLRPIRETLLNPLQRVAFPICFRYNGCGSWRRVNRPASR